MSPTACMSLDIVAIRGEGVTGTAGLGSGFGSRLSWCQYYGTLDEVL